MRRPRRSERGMRTTAPSGDPARRLCLRRRARKASGGASEKPTRQWVGWSSGMRWSRLSGTSTGEIAGRHQRRHPANSDENLILTLMSGRLRPPALVKPAGAEPGIRGPRGGRPDASPSHRVRFATTTGSGAARSRQRPRRRSSAPDTRRRGSGLPPCCSPAWSVRRRPAS